MFGSYRLPPAPGMGRPGKVARAAARGGGKGGKGAKGGMGPRGKYAFKVLCPDDFLAHQVLGPKGSIKNQLEEESGCKIVASNRGEYYPGTQLRILVIYGPEPEAICQVLERVIEKIVECADKGDTAFLGKESGEYALQGAISKQMASGLVGVKGAKIQAIRNETNAKVFIDNTTHQGHQSIRIIGELVSLENAIRKVNQHVQDSADEPWFEDWAMVRTMVEGSEAPFLTERHAHRNDDRERSPRRGGHRDSGGWDSDSWDNDGYDNGAVASAARSGGDADVSSFDVDSMAQVMEESILKVPEGFLEKEHTLACQLQSDVVSKLIGKKGQYVKHVERETGARIVFKDVFEDQVPDPDRQEVVLTGPMLGVYQAHAMLMKRFHEHKKEQEALEAQPQESAEVLDIKAQLEEMQQKLLEAQSGIKGKEGKKDR